MLIKTFFLRFKMTTNSSIFEGDFFCEQRFWHDMDTPTPVTHPMAAFTGIIMILMPDRKSVV